MTVSIGIIVVGMVVVDVVPPPVVSIDDGAPPSEDAVSSAAERAVCAAHAVTDPSPQSPSHRTSLFI
jgi:hypothetical protein